MKITSSAVLVVGVFCSSASSFAAPGCTDYAKVANADIAKEVAFSVSYTYTNISFKKNGQVVSTERSDPYDVRLKTYNLPTSIGRKIYYRFHKAESMGVRMKTGRLICFFTAEYSDGYKSGEKSFIFDVAQSADISNVRMTFGPEESYAGFAFDPHDFAQQMVNMAISKTVINDVEFNDQLARAR